MSLLKNLKKKQTKIKSTGALIKTGEVIVLETQEELNYLIGFFEGIDADSIIVDEPYIAYMDSYPALVVSPIKEFSDDIDHFIEACKHKNMKPIEFNTWKKRNS